LVDPTGTVTERDVVEIYLKLADVFENITAETLEKFCPCKEIVLL
jgi:hypothetical protein